MTKSELATLAVSNDNPHVVDERVVLIVLVMFSIDISVMYGVLLYMM